MSDGRWEGPDERLGAALRELEVPEHAPGFEPGLRRRIAAEERRRRPWRGLAAAFATRRRAGFAAVAAAAVVAVLVVMFALPGSGPVGPQRALAAEVKARVASAMAAVRTMTGEVVATSRHDRSDRMHTTRFTFALTDRGDIRVRASDGSVNSAYDAATGVQRALQPSASLGGGPLFASEQRGLAPGPPDAAPSDWVVQRQLGSAVRALLADADPAVAVTTFQGRPAWRLDVDVTPNLIYADFDHLVVTVDQETGVPVDVVASLDGRLQSVLRVEKLTVNRPLPADAFSLPFPAGAEVLGQDNGFRRVPLADVAGLVGYRPLVPTSVPEGFRLAEVATAHEAQATGSEGSNPVSRMVVSLLYRRGLDQFLVTTRLRAADPAAPAQAWDDPLAAGEGIRERQEAVDLPGGALAGAQARIVIGPRSIPHLWALTGSLVVTVGGDLSRAEILSVAGSLAPAP